MPKSRVDPPPWTAAADAYPASWFRIASDPTVYKHVAAARRDARRSSGSAGLRSPLASAPRGSDWRSGWTCVRRASAISSRSRQLSVEKPWRPQSSMTSRETRARRPIRRSWVSCSLCPSNRRPPFLRAPRLARCQGDRLPGRAIRVLGCTARRPAPMSRSRPTDLPVSSVQPFVAFDWIAATWRSLDCHALTAQMEVISSPHEGSALTPRVDLPVREASDCCLLCCPPDSWRTSRRSTFLVVPASEIGGSTSSVCATAIGSIC